MTVTVSIGDVAKIQSSSIDPRKYPDTLFQLYSIPGFDNDKAPEQLLGSNIGSNKSILPQRGVLFSKLNPRINRVWVIDSSDAAKRVASTEFVCLVPEEKHLDLEFLAWRLRVPGVANQLPIAAAAATKSRQRIQPKSLLALPIPLPPLDEQRRIVGILNRAAKIERLRKQAADRLREFIPALFIKMFGDPVGNPMGWCVEQLGNVITNGLQNGLYKPKSKYGLGTPILRIDNIYRGNVTDPAGWKRVRLDNATVKKYALSENDIVVNRVNSRPFLGKSAIIPKTLEPTVFESNMMRMKLDSNRILPKFLISMLQIGSIRQQLCLNAKDAINQSSINQTDVCKLSVVVPPLEHQCRYNEIVEKTGVTLAVSEAGSNISSALTISLTARLLGDSA